MEPLRITPSTNLDAVCPLTFWIVVDSTPDSRLWNEFIARYH